MRLKRKAVEDRANCQQHKNAVMAELLSRTSYFQKELDRKETIKDSVYYNALLTMYWLVKEEVANKKIVSLPKLLKQLGLGDMRFFQHRSQGSIREMFLLLGHTVKAQMIKKVSEGSSYGLLSDEVCDISNKEQLVTFVKYVDREISKANTSFLDVSNLLESSTSANAETITHTIITQQIDDTGLNRQNLSSFASDGVSVMTGKTNGVAARLRRTVNPSLINIHCICHRLALACASANDNLFFLLKVEKFSCSCGLEVLCEKGCCICQSCYELEEGPSQDKKGKEKTQKTVQESLQNPLAFN